MERDSSVLDQFRSAEERVAKRLRELRPLVEEYQQLERVAQRFGLNLDEDATAPDERRPASGASAQGRRPRSKTRARSAASAREKSGDAAAAKRSAARTPGRRARASRRSDDGGGPGSNRR